MQKKIFISSSTFIENRDYLFKRRGFYSGPNTKKMIEDFNSNGDKSYDIK